MNMRHTAVLVLVGWYLILPPLIIMVGMLCIANAQQSLELLRTQEQPLLNIPSRAALATPAEQRGANVETIPAVTPSAKQTPIRQLPLPVREEGRPPALQEQRGCELWNGTFSGNDPSVLVEARLCTDNQSQVTGVVQWSSLRSGYNVREVVGASNSDGRVVLHDTGFREYHPLFWWRFCLIDQYVLDHDGSNHLVGTYQSDACNDQASVNLYLSP
jgi:hypothetical protein